MELLPPFSTVVIHCLIEPTDQPTQRGPSFTGLGKVPCLTASRIDDRLSGIISNTFGKRMNPVRGRSFEFSRITLNPLQLSWIQFNRGCLGDHGIEIAYFNPVRKQFISWLCLSAPVDRYLNLQGNLHSSRGIPPITKKWGTSVPRACPNKSQGLIL